MDKNTTVIEAIQKVTLGDAETIIHGMTVAFFSAALTFAIIGLLVFLFSKPKF